MFKKRKAIIIILMFALAFSLIGCEGTDLSKDQNDELAKKKEEDTNQQTNEQQQTQTNDEDSQMKKKETSPKQPKQEIDNTEEKESEQRTDQESKQQTYNSEYQKVKVVKHVDGDTVYIKLPSGKTEKVRFIGVNTPESTIRHEPYGEEASNYTKSKLLGETVYIAKDVSNRDQYGRLLRYIWLERPEQVTENEIRSKMFNAILVLEGYAQAATYPPDVKYAHYFRKFQREARNKGKGLWGLKEETDQSKQNQTKVQGEEIKLIDLTKTVEQGNQATITIKGTEGVEYNIEVYYKSGPSKAAGLEPKVAGSDGLITWIWKVGSRTSEGTYPIVVTGGGKELEVKFKVVK